MLLTLDIWKDQAAETVGLSNTGAAEEEAIGKLKEGTS